MKRLAGLASFLLYTHLVFGLAVAALCIQTAVFLDWLFVPTWLYVLFFLLAISIGGTYHLLPVTFTRTDRSDRSLPNLRPLFKIILLLPAAGSVLLFTKLSHFQLYSLLAICFAGALSAILWTKTSGLFKWLSLPLIVTIGTTLLPASFIPYGFDARFWWLLAVRFFNLLAVMMPFVLKQEIEATQTRPTGLLQMFGKEGCFKMAYSALAIAAVGVVPGLLKGINILLLIPYLISLVITGRLLHFSHNHEQSTAACLSLQGCIILQLILICIPMLIP